VRRPLCNSGETQKIVYPDTAAPDSDRGDRFRSGRNHRLLGETMRTCLIALSLFIALPALAAPDYAREKRWDEEVSPGIVVGEAVYLEQKNKHKFLAIYTEAPKARIGVVVVHGLGIHPDWGMTGTLRQRLPEVGYTTLSIQMPVLAVDAKVEDYFPVFPEAVERLHLAVNDLKKRGYKRVAIVSHSLGSIMSHEYLTAHPDGADAWASLGISRGRTYEKIRIPVLDLYGANDTSDVSHLPEPHAFQFGRASGMTPGANEQMDIYINAYDTARKLRHMTTVILGTTIPPIEGLGTMDGKSGLSGLGGFSVEGDGSMDAVSGLSGTLGDLVLPEVVSATPLGPTTVRVTFDTPMLDNTNLNDPSNYTFTPEAGGAAVSGTGVTPEAVPNPTYVDVETIEHTDGIDYTVEVNNVQSQYNNDINTGLNTAVYNGIGDLPQLAAVEVLSSTRIKLTFSEEMILNGALTSPSNYSVTPVTPGAAPVFFTEVETPIGDNFPIEVELPISEMTDGATYNVAVNTAGPTDRALNTMDPGSNNLNFIGEGVAPGLLRIVPISSNRVDVVFNEPMDDNSDIRDPANYTWDNGLSTLNVLDVVSDTVQLVTSEQAEGTLYTLTINY